MSRFVRTARAENDLIEIWLYIAADSADSADVLLDKIDAWMRLAQNPNLGPARPDLAPGFRHSVIGNYLILYREITDGIEIVRVVHGARYLSDLI